MVKRDSDFLGLKKRSARIKPFKNQINTALVFGRLILTNDRRVYNTVIQAAPIIRVDCLVRLLLPLILNIL
jgi:hypothetical protein